MKKYYDWLNDIIDGHFSPYFFCEIKDEGFGTTEFWGAVDRDVRKFRECDCYVEIEIDETFIAEEFEKMFEEKKEDLEYSLKEIIPDFADGDEIAWDLIGNASRRVKVYITYVSNDNE